MAKTQEELNVIKEEVKSLNKKLAELTEDELQQVIGGIDSFNHCIICMRDAEACETCEYKK